MSQMNSIMIFQKNLVLRESTVISFHNHRQVHIITVQTKLKYNE